MFFEILTVLLIFLPLLYLFEEYLMKKFDENNYENDDEVFNKEMAIKFLELSNHERDEVLPKILEQYSKLQLKSFHPSNKITREIVDEYIDVYNNLNEFKFEKEVLKFLKPIKQKIIIGMYFLSDSEDFEDEKYEEFVNFKEDFKAEEKKTKKNLKFINNVFLPKKKILEIVISFDFIYRVILMTNDKYWIELIKSCLKCKNTILNRTVNWGYRGFLKNCFHN